MAAGKLQMPSSDVPYDGRYCRLSRYSIAFICILCAMGIPEEGISKA